MKIIQYRSDHRGVWVPSAYGAHGGRLGAVTNAEAKRILASNEVRTSVLDYRAVDVKKGKRKK